MEFVAVASIALICLVLGQVVKLIPGMPSKLTPVVVAIVGGVLGGVGLFLGVPQLIGLHIFDAIATGAFSGITASGLFSGIKNIAEFFTDGDNE